MKILLRILKFSAVTITIILIVLFTASLVMQDKVAGIILRSLGKEISTRFEFENIRLSFIRKFPKASLELKNVVVYSTPDYDRSSFEETETDTLLSASSVTADFKITDFIKGVYTIETIGVKDGCVNLLTDSLGFVNYNIYVKRASKDTPSAFTLDLERINISNISATYHNLATRLLIKAVVKNGRLKSRISKENIDFSAEGNMRIDYFSLYNYTISKSIEARSDLKLSSSDKGISFSKSTLSLDNYLFGLSGTISRENVYDLIISGDKINISILKDYMPDKFHDLISEYDPSGILNIEGKISGPASRTINPGLETVFNVAQGNVTLRNSDIKLKDLSFRGLFTNGPGKIPATSSLSISDLSGILGSSRYTGSLLLNNFNELRAIMSLKGKVLPSEIKDFFNLEEISAAGGSVDMDLTLEGLIPGGGSFKVLDLLSMKSSGDLRFNSFSIGLRNNDLLFNDVNGELHIADTVLARNVNFKIRDHEISLSGSFINLMEWIAGKEVVMSGSADLSFNSLEPEKLFAPIPGPPDHAVQKKKALYFPNGLVLDVDLSIDNVKYKTFAASEIAGKFSYKPRILNFKTLTFKSLEGSVSGEGFLAQNKDNTFIGRGTFALESININKAFTSFHNFGQSFIRAENLAGTLSGSLSLLMPMDTLFHPQIKSITAEGKYVLVSGGLINFNPVKELSSFIELEELQNIHFEKLENDFFIRNNYLYIPQMDVKSSAADLAINGKHSFENDYEYHVKILLSEALSRKVRKPKSNTTEFGAVQDDGLGKTSLLLKIVNKEEDVKVSYDIKAAGTQVKNEIRSERQNLKTILNEEYGWYSNDTTLTKTKPAPARKFRIVWEELDSTKIN